MPHIHTEPGQFDHTVEVFVVCKGKVLLRKHDKYHIWLGVGGHIELDEDPNQTAIREVKEEVGLTVSLHSVHPLPPVSQGELIPPVFLNRHPIDKTHWHVSYIYFARSKNQKVVPENEHDEWCWLTRQEVEGNQLNMLPNIQFYALAALDALG